MKLWHFAIASCALLGSSTKALASVIVVDDSGGADFTQIQAAVDAAVDGDTILVKPGNYVGFTIAAKGLTVVGDVGLNSISGRAFVQNLTAGQTVTLANLKVFGAGSSVPLVVLNCDGAVRIVNCEWYGRPQNLGGSITNADRVALVGCTVVGGDGLYPNPGCIDGGGNGFDGGHAFHVENSSIAMYDSLTRGGEGGGGELKTYPGGWGACVFSGFMFAGRSNITGGQGADATCVWTCGNAGGYGWYVDPVASGWELDCMVSGGLNGSSPAFGEGCYDGPPVTSPAYYDEVPFQFAAPNIGFSIPHIAREGTFVQVTFIGPPGAQVFLNDELTTTHEPTAIWRGVLIAPFPESVIGPAKSRRWGTIPASGELIKSYQVPMLPPGEEAQTRFLQAYRIGPNGLTLGTFRTLTVLDSAF